MPEPREFADGSEDLPLLDDSEWGEDRQSEAVIGSATHTQLTSQKRKRIVLLLALAIFCFTMSNGLSETAVMRISEDNLCRRYYAAKGQSDKSIDEKLCKVEDVQSALAYLDGFQSALDATVGLLVGFPFGILADKIGRKPIILLSGLGTIMSSIWVAFVLWFPQQIPINFILVEAVFKTIGGGSTVAVAVLYSVLSDIASQADRASYFFYVAFSGLIGSFIGPIVSSYLMAVFTPWLPVLLDLAISPLALGTVSTLPETLPYTRLHSGQDRPCLVEDEDESGLSIKSHIYMGLSQLHQFARGLTQTSLFLILITCLLQVPEILAATQFFIQYVSKRFSWSLAEAGYLLGFRALVTIVVLLAVLPVLGSILQSKGHSAHRSGAEKDLALARMSALCGSVGSLLMAGPSIGVVVTGMSINTLAAGFGPLLRSLAANFVGAKDTSKLYVLISTVETIGSLYAGPALAWLFETGMKRGDVYLGLPYYALAGSFSLAFCALLFVRVPKSP